MTYQEQLAEASRPLDFKLFVLDYFRITNRNFPATILLAQCAYWSRRKKDGWFYMTRTDWERELCFTRNQVERSITILRSLGLIESRKDGLKPRALYRVNAAVLVEKVRQLKPLFHVESDDDETLIDDGVDSHKNVGLLEAKTSGTETSVLGANAPKTRAARKPRPVPGRNLPAVGLFFRGSLKAKVPVNGTAGPGGHQENLTHTPAEGGRSPSDPPMKAARPPLTSAQKAKWAAAVERNRIIDLYPLPEGDKLTDRDRAKIRGQIQLCEKRGLTLEQIARQVERLAKMVGTGDYRKHRVPKTPLWFFLDPEVVADQRLWGPRFFPLVQDWDFQLESWGWGNDAITLPSADSQPASPATQEGGVCRVIPPKSS